MEWVCCTALRQNAWARFYIPKHHDACNGNVFDGPVTGMERPVNFNLCISGAANGQILGWTPTGGRKSNIIHQMKAKNLRIQKLRDAGTEKLY